MTENAHTVKVNITCRHLDLTEGIKTHAEKKFAHILTKYAHQDLVVHLVLQIEKSRQIAEATVHVKEHNFQAKEEGTDLYGAIDKVAEILGVQLRKNKEKMVSHH